MQLQCTAALAADTPGAAYPLASPSAGRQRATYHRDESLQGVNCLGMKCEGTPVPICQRFVRFFSEISLVGMTEVTLTFTRLGV